MDTDQADRIIELLEKLADGMDVLIQLAACEYTEEADAALWGETSGNA